VLSVQPCPPRGPQAVSWRQVLSLPAGATGSDDATFCSATDFPSATWRGRRCSRTTIDFGTVGTQPLGELVVGGRTVERSDVLLPIGSCRLGVAGLRCRCVVPAAGGVVLRGLRRSRTDETLDHIGQSALMGVGCIAAATDNAERDQDADDRTDAETTALRLHAEILALELRRDIVVGISQRQAFIVFGDDAAIVISAKFRGLLPGVVAATSAFGAGEAP
jgi:hypothetical protein